MRRPDGHPTKVTFTYSQGLRRPQGGVVNTPSVWLRRYANSAYPGAPVKTLTSAPGSHAVSIAVFQTLELLKLSVVTRLVVE